MRQMFDEQLKLLREEMLKMSAACEQAIAKAVKSFTDNNNELADSVIASAEAIDRKEREIESQCIKLLLTQQPVATDLRTVSAALKMVTDMERIGNQAADIAEIVKTGDIPNTIDKHTIHDMAVSVIKMISESVESFATGNTDKAKEIIEYDDVIDQYFETVKSELIEDFKKNADFGKYGIDLLMIAKYLERSGDHAVNIAKWVIFASSGIIKV